MAKDRGEATVEVPASVLERLTARLEALEAAQRVAAERADDLHPKQVYDAAWEKRVAEASRSAAERTQDRSDRDYGVKAPRWQVRLDPTTEDGRPGPNVSEWPALVISANSPEEAQGRWMILCGVKKHDYTLRAEPVAPVAA